MPDPTTREVLRLATARLAGAGIDSARADAEILLAFALQISRGNLITVETLTVEQASTYSGFVARRCRREPLQHIVGTAPFRYLELEVGPGVFVPRPETETLVDLALEFIRANQDGQRLRVLDLCTGSAVIPLAIATEARNVDVFAIEREPAAYEWAQRNVAKYQAEIDAAGSTLTLLLADAADAPTLIGNQVDVLASNPPYVPVEGRPLEPEVRDYDPHTALFAGDDGMDVVRLVVAVGSELLKPGGLLLIEHSDAQGVDHPTGGVPAIVEAGEYAGVADHKDLTGRPRVTTATRGVKCETPGWMR